MIFAAYVSHFGGRDDSAGLLFCLAGVSISVGLYAGFLLYLCSVREDRQPIPVFGVPVRNGAALRVLFAVLYVMGLFGAPTALRWAHSL